MTVAVSQDFKNALRQTHRRHIKVDVLDDQNRVLTQVPVADGTLTQDLDLDSGVRWGRLDVSDPAFVPSSEDAPLAPFAGHRVRPWVGVDVAGDVEWCTLGLYLVAKVDVQYPFRGLSVTLADLALMVAQDHRERPFRYDPDQSAASLIRSIVRQVYPSATVARDDSRGATVGTLQEDYQLGTSKWQIVRDIADNVGCDVMFDAYGRLALIDRQAAAHATEVVDAGPNGVMVGLDASLSRLGVVNRSVLVLDSDKRGTFRGITEITSGPLRESGPFGRANYVEVQTVKWGTQQTADKRSRRRLARRSSMLRELTIQTAPMPHLQAGDTVMVTFPNGSTEHAFIEMIEHSLGPTGQTTLVTRWGDGDVLGPLAFLDGGFLAGSGGHQPPDIPDTLPPTADTDDTAPGLPPDEQLPPGTGDPDEPPNLPDIGEPTPPDESDPTPPDPVPDTWRPVIATYNVPSRYSNTDDEIVRLGRDWQVSVVAFQERPNPPVPPGWQLYNPSRNGATLHNPLAWDSSVWEPIHTGTYKISPARTIAAPFPNQKARYVVWAHLRDKQYGSEISVGSVHLLFDKYSDPSRKALWELQRDGCVDWLTKNPRRVLMGDFNTNPTTMNMMQPLHDAATVLVAGTKTHAKGFLDHIWIRDTSVVTPITATAPSGFASDHRPLVGTVELSTP